MLRKALPLIIIFVMLGNVKGFQMRRTILGVGEWYFKILMTLGTCKESLLFSEQKIWGRVRMNRIFDIYYQSENVYFKVSRVEIELVVNDSDVMGYSEEGVGSEKFSATLYLPLNTFVIFYSLKIFTCDVPEHMDKGNNVQKSVYFSEENSE